VLAAAAAATLAACGYGFTQHYVAKGGAGSVHVRAFENLSTQPELGVAVTSALRTELSRRGADAGDGAAAFIEGDVRATEPMPATTRVVAASGVAGAASASEIAARREAVFLAGADPLETEGRRALALRQLAQDAARDVLRAFEN
jgi:lipopolysaccharide assembly LptE-like protein